MKNLKTGKISAGIFKKDKFDTKDDTIDPAALEE